MLRLFATIHKEFLVLTRDRSGLAIMFVMPVLLVTIMALIQDAPFRDYQELRIPTLLVNDDRGATGGHIMEGLVDSKIFEIQNISVSEQEARRLVANGDYEIGIYIPANTSQRMDGMVQYYVDDMLNKMGVVDSVFNDTIPADETSDVVVFFTPGIKKSFKNSVISGIRQINSKLESQALIAGFESTLNSGESDSSLHANLFGDFIHLREISTGNDEQMKRELNSVQHNVPAWTMFGIFFIVISLAGSIIKEREEGSYMRLLTMPGSYVTVLSGKIIAYLCISLLQVQLMLLVGLYLLPLFDLPRLVIGNNYFIIIIAALCSGMAASGYGVLIGTIFRTHQQSSTFGAVSVVILAALGGIWVPVYVMPDSIRLFAELSPLYWGLNAFQSIFLGDASAEALSGYIYKLLLFFAVTVLSAVFINKIRIH